MRPPDWIMRFFRWFCREELCDAIEGDMITVYSRKVKELGAFRARLWYFFNVLTFLQPFAVKKNRLGRRLSGLDMIRSYIKIAGRNLLASKAFTLINVSGLAIGIAGFVVMLTYVQSELSYDRFHTKSERLVRVTYDYEAQGAIRKVAKSAFPIKPMLLDNYPGVEKVVRFYRNTLDASTLKFGDNHFTEEHIIFADPEVFEVFDFELEQGNPGTALTDVNSIVLTEKIARKYFGDENPLGKIIEYKNSDKLKVTGILKELPSNSHMQFDILVPVELQRQRWIRGNGNNGYDFEQDWRWSGSWMYVLLESPEVIDRFEQQLVTAGKDYFGRDDNVEYTYAAQPITDIHLYSDMAGEFSVNGNINQVYNFGIIAILILVIACINFVNLSTARSARRAKEVGLRKVMGAHRLQLVAQFVAESILIALIATLVSILLIELMLPFFNHFMGQSLEVSYWENPRVIPFFLVGAVIIGLLAGTYPAFYISAYKPVKTLKGNTSTGSHGNASLRKVLVSTQFIISNLLIISILVVQQQLNFIKGKDLGFDKDQVIVLTHGNKLGNQFDLFQSKLTSNPAVIATNQGYVAGTGGLTQTFKVNGEVTEAGKSMGIKHVSFDFLDMFGMKVIAGRNFSREIDTDWNNAIMLNESAVKSFGWTNEEALTKTFSYVGGSDNRTRFKCKVIGVLADAHLEPLYQPIRPSVFKQAKWGKVSVKLNTKSGDDLRAAISTIEQAWNDIIPHWPFEFVFLDETIEKQYQKEERLGQTIQYFTFLAIFIAGLGLFGLASYTVQQRTREIGVRKVLGASVNAIIALVGKQFLWLIAISFIISIPIGYYLAGQWLQGFEYRIPVGVGVFMLSGIVSVLIAGFAIGGQSLRAATINPVKTLRHE